ncbi:hypothetical protein INR49_010731 [Caranx melampygus]|nr:hypothetical protein INR49_010731 [Caranx melampygus]
MTSLHFYSNDIYVRVKTAISSVLTVLDSYEFRSPKQDVKSLACPLSDQPFHNTDTSRLSLTSPPADVEAE